MSGLPWFRMYVDFLEDSKIVSLAFEDQRHFISILCLKSAGVLDQDCDQRLLDRIVAQKIWVDFALIDDVRKRLLDAGLIERNWQPKAWNKRQFRSDHDPSRAERQQRYKKKRKGNALPNAPGNGKVTTVEQNRIDTDTDTDTEKKAVSLPDWLPSEEWALFVEERKASKHPLTNKAAKMAITELDKLRQSGNDPSEVIRQSIINGWRGLFPLKTTKAPPKQESVPMHHQPFPGSKS